MLSARAARWRLSLGCLLALTPATALAVTATASPASADSVRNAEQWVLNAVDAPAAWPVSQGQGVVVAVIDSGVKPDVSDLTGSVITGPDYSGVHTPPSNPNWGMHGTWMASLIAGRLVARAPGRLDRDALVAAIRWAKRVHHAALARSVDVGRGLRVIVF